MWFKKTRHNESWVYGLSVLDPRIFSSLSDHSLMVPRPHPPLFLLGSRRRTDRLGKWNRSHSLGIRSFWTRIECHFTPCSSTNLEAERSVRIQRAIRSSPNYFGSSYRLLNLLNPCTFVPPSIPARPPFAVFCCPFPLFTLFSFFQLKF